MNKKIEAPKKTKQLKKCSNKKIDCSKSEIETLCEFYKSNDVKRLEDKFKRLNEDLKVLGKLLEECTHPFNEFANDFKKINKPFIDAIKNLSDKMKSFTSINLAKDNKKKK